MKILLIHDNAKAGVRRLLANETGVSILEAQTDRDARYLCRRWRPDLTILDLDRPAFSGFALLHLLIASRKAVRVLVIGGRSGPFYAARFLQAGALGYLSRNAGSEEFITAVRRTAKGDYHVEREIAVQLAIGRPSSGTILDQLTNREIDILRLRAEGLNYSEISSVARVPRKSIEALFSRISGGRGVDADREQMLPRRSRSAEFARAAQRVRQGP
jgi:two-component system, NarL family, invasion response regulator UvrY